MQGLVQGVGFRNFVERRAAALGLSGYVMNLADGRVRVHAEGAREAIEELARHLERGPRLARVERVTVSWLPLTERFSTFDIRYREPEP